MASGKPTGKCHHHVAYEELRRNYDALYAKIQVSYFHIGQLFVENEDMKIRMNRPAPALIINTAVQEAKVGQESKVGQDTPAKRPLDNPPPNAPKKARSADPAPADPAPAPLRRTTRVIPFNLPEEKKDA